MAVLRFLCALCVFCIVGIQHTRSQGSPSVDRVKPRDNIVRDIRSKILYPYEKRHLLRNLNAFNPKEDKTLNFNFPYYGFNYNYVWVTAHGTVLFSNAPPTLLGAGNELGKHLLEFPIKEWPKIDDPALIAPFLALAVTGRGTSGTIDQELPPGVYFQDVVSMGFKSDSDDADIVQYRADLGEALRLDLEEGMIGAAGFIPKHVFIVTWRNMTFSGSGDSRITNTYQLVLTTDEVRTYVMFNYERLNWFASKDSGGNEVGFGGVEAYVGFNAGNGTSSFEYTPYSQFHKIKDLLTHGLVNGFPGRHVFRVDEEILRGVCNHDPPTLPKLTLSPEHGHMLGGTIVNVTGPCLPEDQKQIKIKFHDKTITCHRYSRNMATCITPPIYSAGYVDVHTLQEVDGRSFANKFYIENPMMAMENVRFDNDDVTDRYGKEQLDIRWDWHNLTWNRNAPAQISLWGYRENAMKPELIHITVLADTPNSGFHSLDLTQFQQNDDGWKRDFLFGLIQVNITLQDTRLTPFIWSHPIPLAWYFHHQWVRYYGEDWKIKFCNKWNQDDRRLKNFAHEVPRCPCTFEQAEADVGRFAPDFGCDITGNAKCYGNEKTVHCVRSGQSAHSGAGQQCCYGTDGDLVMNVDMKEGGVPSRSHPFGLYPYDKSTEIPGMSHWYHDRVAYYTCCLWQDEMTENCYQYKWRRASQDCVGYQPPNASVVFGDPHFITFDNYEYTFNGKGEFVLVTVDHKAHTLDVQGRFEQIIDYKDIEKKYSATQLTAIVAKDNSSIPVEVQIRPPNARLRYHLNVLADGKKIYFDRPSLKTQVFRGVTVYCPTAVHDQSHIIIMLQSGAGVEVTERKGYLAARVYLPKTFMNTTRGLMGNWSNNIDDDFMSPDSNQPPLSIASAAVTNFQFIHEKFGLEWMLDDSVAANSKRFTSYFTHENSRTGARFNDKEFVPAYEKEPAFNSSFSMTERDISMTCGNKQQTSSYQCRYDYLTTQNKIFAETTKFNGDNFRKMKSTSLKTIITCGALDTPRHGRKSSYKYVVGTKVNFECQRGYVFVGEPTRHCFPRGEWSWTEYEFTRCLPEDEYNARQAGITSGIVLGVLIPIIIGAICLFGFIVSKRNDSSYRESHQMDRIARNDDDDNKKKKPETSNA